jgi:Protein of unknown function (DUF2867)
MTDGMTLTDIGPCQRPATARLVAPRDAVTYLDCQTATLPRRIPPLALWDAMMARPLPGLGLAFRLRDAVSARFGVGRIGGFSGRPAAAVQIGDRLDFFLIEGLSDSQLVLTARDRHLEVMVSVDIMGQQVWITASVITKNLYGRAYMIPVGLAHPLIVRGMLRRAQIVP